jgi:hypothetical protein
MEPSNKKQFQVLTNYEDLLRITADQSNEIYKTDFVITRYVHDENNFAIIGYVEASQNDVFTLGVNFGRRCEVLDKKSSTPPHSLWD